MVEEPTQDTVASPGEQDRRRNGLLWLAFAILLLVIAWLLWDYLSRSTSSGEVVGVSATRAQLPAARPEYDYDYDTTAVGDDDEAGYAPSVPDVVGLTNSDAVGTLERAGYEAQVTRMYSDSKPKGVVFEQVPAGGQTADAGSTVRVLVSGGPEPSASVKVPDLVGLKKAAALDKIEAAGLDAKIMVQPRYEGVGKVLEQQPAPGTMVVQGSKVFILVITSY